MERSSNLTVLEGMPAEFKCRFVIRLFFKMWIPKQKAYFLSFRSDLAVMVHWVRPAAGTGEDFDRSNSSNFRSVRDDLGQPAIGDVLHIPSAGPADAGMYFCVGQTNTGMTPGFLHLTVLDRDQAIREAPRNVTAAEGETATFSCRTHLDLHR